MLRYLALIHGRKSPLPSGEVVPIVGPAIFPCAQQVQVLGAKPLEWPGLSRCAWLERGAVKPRSCHLSGDNDCGRALVSGSGRPTPLSQGAPHGSSLKERDHREASHLPLAHRECAKGHCFEDVPYSLTALYLLSSA